MYTMTFDHWIHTQYRTTSQIITKLTNTRNNGTSVNNWR